MKAAALAGALWVISPSAAADESVSPAPKQAPAPTTAPPTPTSPVAPTAEPSPEDLAVLRDMELLMELEMLRNWDPESDLPIPADPISANILDVESER